MNNKMFFYIALLGFSGSSLFGSQKFAVCKYDPKTAKIGDRIPKSRVTMAKTPPKALDKMTDNDRAGDKGKKELIVRLDQNNAPIFLYKNGEKLTKKDQTIQIGENHLIGALAAADENAPLDFSGVFSIAEGGLRYYVTVANDAGNRDCYVDVTSEFEKFELPTISLDGDNRDEDKPRGRDATEPLIDQNSLNKNKQKALNDNDPSEEENKFSLLSPAAWWALAKRHPFYSFGVVGTLGVVAWYTGLIAKLQKMISRS